jgi:hypothetical protein
VPADIRKVVLELMSEDLLPHDAAALFWYVRSAFYFHLHLDKNECVLLFKYEDFVAKPYLHFESIYNFIGFSLPDELKDNTINASSVRKGAQIKLTPKVEKLCESMYQQFEKVYAEKAQFKQYRFCGY